MLAPTLSTGGPRPLAADRQLIRSAADHASSIRPGRPGRPRAQREVIMTGWTGLWSRGHDRTGHGGAHRSMRSRTTWRHTSQPVSGIAMPKLWAYTSSRGTAVASTS